MAEHALARERDGAAPPKKKELTIGMVSEMTGYSLVELALIRNTVAKDVGEDLVSLALFLTSAKKLGLEPLLRQVHWIMRDGKGTIQIGIDGFRAIAERSGAYAGSEPPSFRGTIEQAYIRDGKRDTMIVPERASVTVWRIVQGHKAAFTGEAYWTEFYPGDKPGFMYRKMPRLMLAKDAEAQALRKAFPALLSAVDYESDVSSDITELEEVAAPPRVLEQPALERPKSRPKPPPPPPGEYDRIFPADEEPGPRVSRSSDAKASRGVAPRDAQPQAGDAQEHLSPSASAWARNRELHDEAYALGMRPKTLPSTATIAEVEQQNADLEAAIDASDDEE